MLAVGTQVRPATLILMFVAVWVERRGLFSGYFFGISPAFALLPLLAIPESPFGSRDALGRADPRGDWEFPKWLHWVLLAVVGVGVVIEATAVLTERGPMRGIGLWAKFVKMKLDGTEWQLFGLRTAAGFGLLVPKLRPWAWLALLLTELTFQFQMDVAGYGRLFLLILAADPAWIPGARPADQDTIFYDGDCGLCHGTIRFLLSEAPSGHAFRFGALQGETFRRDYPSQASLPPSSIILRTGPGKILDRSTAVLELLSRLGGLYRPFAALFRLLPRALRDTLYAFVAQIRHRLFSRPSGLCPLLPPHLRDRFLD